MKKFMRFIPLCIICLAVSSIFLLSPVSIGKSVQVRANTILSNNENQYNQESIDLRPLTSEQIENFVKEKKITPLTIKNIENYTVILSETNYVISFYALTSDQNGYIKHEGGGSGSSKQHITPISIGSGGGGGTEIGTYSFDWIVIHDKDILNKAYSMKITYDNKTELTELVNNNKGFIIPTPKDNLKALNVAIYDKNGAALYKKVMR